MNYLRHIVRSVLFCITAAGLLWGPGAAPVPIDSLVAASDGIVVGTITQGTVSGTTVALSVQVERALKGSWEPGSIVAATTLISESWPTREIKPARGIFFLANAGTGPMRLLPVDTGYLLHEGQTFMHLPNTSTPAAVTVAASSPNERVVLEYLGVIEATPPDQLGGVNQMLSNFNLAPTTPALLSVFQRWSAGSSSQLAAAGLQVLLANGDTTALSRLVASGSMRTAAVAPHF